MATHPFPKITLRLIYTFIIVFSCTSVHPKIYDCFTFFNELELLKVRLEELYDVVDHFVIVEASETFSGNPKPLLFTENKEQFEQYQDKIISIVVDDFPSHTADTANDRWVREEFQRNAILRGLANCKNEDIILISDIDEIPNENSINTIKQIFSTHKYPEKLLKTQRSFFSQENRFVYSLQMRLFLFYLNQESPLGWDGGSKAAPYWLVKKRSPWKLKILQMYDKNLKKIHDAGWHFHSMGGLERINYKLHSIEPNMTAEEFINWTNNLWEPFITPINNHHPKYIYDRINDFNSIGWIK